MSEYKIITRKIPHSSISEQYRKIRSSIDFSNLDKTYKVLNLTSTFPGEGKTVTALNLATVYAQTKQKTLVIDMDLRKPKIHRAFTIPNKGGVSDYVTNEHSVVEGIIKVDDYLDVLVAGGKVPFPSEVLISEKIKNMMEELRGIYDRIIIDCPPMTAVTDATIISNFCDATVYVVASRKTDGTIARDCVNDLKNTGANVIGGILTMIQKRDMYYGMEYYYYYGD